ncbi:hypothetical protein PIB30_026666 [Stylosanthes scabra]|uniref:UDP-glycosyltransferase 83A1 n=1 Tax=Stylosanthes scabra TaxID=79078 RepID=A0ABU6Z770_9FABA|nr:hypothetical protein [Stylosanthes scabra]
MSVTTTVLVLPCPLQGHVNPMMILSQRLVEKGCNIIFVNTEFIHNKVLSPMGNQEAGVTGGSSIKLVSIPDGLGPDADRNNLGELFGSMLNNMPAMLEKLIEYLRLKGGVTVSCIVADFVMAWALEIANKIGIKGVLFNPASTAMLALQCSIPKLIDDGIIDTHGLPITQKRFQLSPTIPPMNTELIWWANISDSITQKKIFKVIVHCMQTLELTEWWLCNSTPEIEPGASSFIPKLLPIGPLLRDVAEEKSLGQFWEEDHSCISWLDQQPHGSVIYVAFGSITLFDEKQFKELALGLDLTNRPFLWVVRKDSDSSNNVSLPSEFRGNRGNIIGWAPQEKVLSHPAIACFISHCGWNSTIEGLSNGVPFLCWPYFADQFFNRTYICDELKVGLGFDSDENGLISREEIKVKVEKLLGDENIRLMAHEVKKKLRKEIDDGGRSSENINKFIKWLKE